MKQKILDYFHKHRIEIEWNLERCKLRREDSFRSVTIEIKAPTSQITEELQDKRDDLEKGLRDLFGANTDVVIKNWEYLNW